MVVKKYTFEKNKKDSLESRLSQYKAQAKNFLTINEKRNKNMRAVFKSGLANILPLAAASLTPFVMYAQPCNGGAGSVNTNCSNTQGVDLDGDGIDVVLLYVPTGTAGLMARKTTTSTMTFARNMPGAYSYLIGYSTGNTIDVNSGNFGSLAALSNTTCVNTNEYGWLDYEGTGMGGWNGLTPGTRVMGLTKDGFLGFIEITYDDNNTNPTTSFSIGEFGLAVDMGIDNITAGDCSSLPVELTRFFGKKENDNYVLGWQTASEANNAGFELQRSTDAENFRKLAWIDGVGNSDVLNDYSYADTELEPNQVYYYRLKQVDIDGRFEYSNLLTYIHVVEGETTVKDFAPNPVSVGFADLRIVSPQQQKAEVAVFDAMGRQVFAKKTTLIKGLHTIRLDLENASSGTHFVQVLLENGTSQYKKLVVVKN
jgi:type IX secretion system substrate protein